MSKYNNKIQDTRISQTYMTHLIAVCQLYICLMYSPPKNIMCLAYSIEKSGRFIALQHECPLLAADDMMDGRGKLYGSAAS
mmetsp:Transcript_11985/g.21778  ORF Transcript_11985/g.21778 Transcript_11985/m.21778 type:complete len:81 (+) Transcript_11985:1797-2039(+)